MANSTECHREMIRYSSYVICLNKSGKEKQWLGILFYWAITKLVKSNMWENHVVTWCKIMWGEKEKQDLELYIRYDYNNVFKDCE